MDGVDAASKYLVVGGLVFVPLSVPFMAHHFGWPKYSPPAELISRLTDPLTTDGAEIVVLAKVLADDINFGCESRSDAPRPTIYRAATCRAAICRAVTAR